LLVLPSRLFFPEDFHMSCMKSAVVACSVLLAASSPAYAASSFSPKEAAYECARAIRDQVGVGAYEVVQMTSHGGRGHYRIWMNAHDDSVGAFCTTKRGEVAETFTRETPWEGSRPRRPQTLALNSDCSATFEG
jgi:hypothetical protein